MVDRCSYCRVAPVAAGRQRVISAARLTLTKLPSAGWKMQPVTGPACWSSTCRHAPLEGDQIRTAVKRKQMRWRARLVSVQTQLRRSCMRGQVQWSAEPVAINPEYATHSTAAMWPVSRCCGTVATPGRTGPKVATRGTAHTDAVWSSEPSTRWRVRPVDGLHETLDTAAVCAVNRAHTCHEGSM